MDDVIQLSDDDDDFIQSVNPTAVRKSTSQQASASSSKEVKVTRRPPPIASIDSDPILKPSSSTSCTEEECPICGRNLRLLDVQRRTLHLNSCLDDGEAKTDLDKKMEKWTSTMDCPVCKTPLAAGPFRNAHMKKCGREHAINGRDLLNLVNTHEKVAETRRKRALPPTSAKTPKLRPKKVSKLDGEPKSLVEEEMIMAKALSESLMEPSDAEQGEEQRKKEKGIRAEGGVSPQFTRILNDNIRKRRSYAVVELAPRGCKCDVIQLIQSRFLRIFRSRRKVLKKVEKKTMKEDEKKGEKKEEENVKEQLVEGEMNTRRRVHMEASMANTLSRLDALSWAYRKLAMEGEERGDVSIDCSDGQIRAFSWALAARTAAMGRVLGEDARLSIEQPTTVVRHWLQYVLCAKVEWSVGPENDGVREIAKLHGPEGLVEECARMSKTRREYRGFGRIGAATEEDTVDTVTPHSDTVTLPTDKVAPSTDTVNPPTDTVPPLDTPKEKEPELVHPTAEAALASDDARMEEEDREEKEEGTVDSEGSMSAALKKCAADGRASARLSSPRPLDGSFLAALQAPPPPIIEITVALSPPTTTVHPPPQDSPKDSFFESIVYGGTPQPLRKEEELEQVRPTTTVIATSTVVQPTDPSESAEESMDESDAMRNILDVSCLRRSPRIRVDGDAKEEEEARIEMGRSSPELFNDSDNSMEEEPVQMSQRVPSPPRRSLRRSVSLSIPPVPLAIVTPTTSRTSRTKSILNRRDQQELIYLEDSPLSSPVTVAKPSVAVLIEKKEEEETTVDETFPRVDPPSYGQGGMDTVDGGEHSRNRDDAMDDEGGEGGGDYDYHYDYNDCDDNWNYEAEEVEAGEGGETDPAVTMTTRAQEEVDSFLQSLRFNETRAKSSSPRKTTCPPEEVDSFLLSFMGNMEKKDDKTEESTGDILGSLSPMRKDDEGAFKTPTVRGGRGKGGMRGRGAVFGSHVKVLKWSNVTPKPRFEAMDDDALKTQLARYGLRPMGRKRAIAMLSDIYEQTHPVVDEGAAAGCAGPSTSSASVQSEASIEGGDISPTRRQGSTVAREDDDDNKNEGEKTLNRGADSSYEDNSDERGEGVGEAEESMIIPKSVLKGADSQLVLFLEWLRQPTQKDLYDHCLALKSISLEEIEMKLKRADSALCGISRKVLMCVLDRLHITYSLPQDGWKKKNKRKGK